MADWTEADIAELEKASAASDVADGGAPPLNTETPVLEPSGSVAPVPESPVDTAAAAPPPDAGAFTEADIVGMNAESDQQDNDALRTAFKSGLQEAPDKQSGVLRLAKNLGADPYVVENNYDRLKATWEASQFDPDAWGKANPDLKKLALSDPRIGRLAVKDEELSLWSKFQNDRADFFQGLYDKERSWLEPIWPSRYSPEKVAADKAGLDSIKVKAKQIEERADGKTDAFNAMSTLDRTVLGPVIRYQQSAQQLDISKKYFELMMARTFNDARGAGQTISKWPDGTMPSTIDTYQIEKDILTAEQAAVPQSIEETAFGKILGDVAEMGASQAATIKAAVTGAGVGGALGGIAGAIVGGASAGLGGIVPGIVEGAAFGARVGGKVGVTAGSFQLEAGGQYQELLQAVRDDGLHVTEQEARGGAIIHGAIASGIELGAMEMLIKGMGPMGERILHGGGKDVVKDLLVRDLKFRQIAARVAAGYLKSAAGEGVEEFSQQTVGQVVDYVTLSKSQGKWQKLPTFADFIEGPLLAGQKGAIGGLGLSLPGAALHLSTRLQEQAHGLRNGAHTLQLAKLAEGSVTAAAAPAEVARMVTEATAKGGEPVTAMHVDPHAFVKLFQSENADPSEAVSKLMGEDGPKLLQQALATGTKLEVPISDYLGKWGGAEVATRLAGDTAISRGGLTLNESAAQQEGIQQRAKELTAQYEKENAEAPTGSEGTYVDALEEQLLATGKLKPDAVKKQVALHRAMLRSMSEAFGIPAEQLFRDYVVTVRREDQPQPSTPAPYNAERVLRERAKTLTTEERSTESFIDSNTGVFNGRASQALPVDASKPLVGHVSVEGIKYVNDNASHDKGDLLYRATARALHAVDPQVAKVGGDFAVRVGSQAELDSVIQQAQAAMPEGFTLTGAVGPTLKEAGLSHMEAKKAAEAAGTRAPRGSKPLGLKADAKALQLPKERANAKVPAALTEKVAGLTPEQYYDERYRDPATGAYTAEGWNALPRRKHVIAFDLKGLKKTNEKYTEAGGDAMIESLKVAANLAGGEFFDFAHLHGDEYAAQTNDPEAAKRFISRLAMELGETPVELLDHATDTYTTEHAEFRFGLGKWTYESADEDLNRRKKLEPGNRAEGGTSFDFGHNREAGSAVDVERGERAGSEPLARGQTGSDARGDGKASSEALAAQDAALANGLDEARAFVGRMRDQAKQALAAAWIQYTQDPSLERPKVPDALEKELAKFGVVDPVHGFTFGENGRSLERPIPGERHFGKEPAELRRQRLMEIQYQLTGDMRGRYEQPAYNGNPSRLLDSSKPIWKQSKEVREAVKQLPQEAKAYFAENGHTGGLEKMTGSELYRGLVAMAEKGPDESTSKLSAEEEASSYLLKHGIPGLTYLDDSKVQTTKTFYQPERLNAGEPSAPRGYMEMSQKGYQRLFDIVLTPTSDLSTLFHEAGHVFLELFGELAERPDAPERVKADYAAALKHIGVSSREEIQTEHHEKFARSFEAYLYEGKAPSKELVPVFERMRLWLKQVYRSILALDAPLSPEIRGVFDRLLASEKEVDDGEQGMGLEPLFRSPEEAGMTPEQWKAYLDDQLKARSTSQRRVELRALKDKLRENESFWKDARREEKKAAEQEYEELPVSRAFHFLLTGDVSLDGETTEKGIAPKLDPERVAFALGRSPAESLLGILKKDGLDPDAVSDLFGFATAREMLEAMEKRPEKAGWVEQRADEKMAERYPDVLQDKEKLKELVSQGLHGEHTSSWLLREWEALQRKAKFDPESQRFFNSQGFDTKLPPLESIQRAAKMLVEKATIRRLDAGLAGRAERTSALNAAKAAAKGNWEQAAIYKQQQLLNFYLNKEYVAARELRDNFESLANSSSKDTARAKLGKASPVYRDGVDSVLEALGFKDEDATREKPLASIGEVVRQMEADGTTILFDQEVVDRILSKRPAFGALTVSDLRAVDGVVRNIQAAARAVSTAILDGKRVEKATLIQDLVAEAASSLPSLGPAVEKSAQSLTGKMGGLFSSLDGSLLRPETMVLWLGGEAKEKSLWFRAIMQPLQEAKVKEVDLLNKTVEPIIHALDHFPEEARGHSMDKVDGAKLFPTWRKDLSPPSFRYQIVQMALNMGNQSNMDRLTGGFGITEQEAIDAINKTLTKSEMDWVQSVWDANESLRPEAFALEERDSGLAPEKIQSKPLATAFGTYRGGYFPALYNRDVEVVGQKQVLGTVAALMDPSFTRPGTAKSHLKSRSEGFAGALSLEPNGITSHLAQVAHDIAYREALKSVGGLLLSPDVQAALRDRLGPDRRGQFLTWIKDVGQMRGMSGSEHAGKMVSAMRAVRGNTVISALGFAVPNMIEDLTNLAAAVPRTDLKSKHLAAAFFEFANPLHTMEASRVAHEKSGELRTRREQMSRELQAKVNNLTQKGPLSTRPLQWVKQHAFALMEASDWATSTPIWMGAYRQALMEGEAEKDAIVKADLVVRQVFASHSPVDTAAIIRDKGFIGSSLMFYGFLNNQYNAVRDIAHPLHTATTKMEAAKRVPKVAGRALGFLLATTVMSEFLRGRGREPDEDWSQWFLRKLGTGALSSVPFGGDVGSYIEAKGFGRQYNPRSLSLVGVATGIGDSALRAVKETLEDGDQQRQKWLQFVGSTIGPLGGVPTAQPMRTSKYLLDVLDGKVQVNTPWDFLSGAIYGERATQPATPFSPTPRQDGAPVPMR